MSIIPSLPDLLQNGTPADATQVMADFLQIQNSVNTNAAENGANSSITSLTGLTTPLSIAQGGTGQITASAARTAFGAAPTVAPVFTGGITVTGGISTDTIVESQNVFVGGVLSVTGTSALTGNTSVGGTLSVSGAATVTGALKAAAGISADGVNPVTGITPGLGDNSTKVATTANVVNSFLGSVNQAWTDVTGSRAFSNTYTNSTSRPIQLNVTALCNASAECHMTVLLNGSLSMIFASSNNAGGGNPTFNGMVIVPPGVTYNVTTTNVNSLVKWYELR